MAGDEAGDGPSPMAPTNECARLADAMNAMPLDIFVRTKINTARPPRGAINRSRLDAVRAAASQVRLVTITAPGGFGKTTLAAAWVQHWRTQGHHCAWLSLESDDDEPARFLYCLAQALNRLSQGVGGAALALLQGSTLAAPRAVVSLLINDLEPLDGEVFVVLDDYQRIHDAAIHDAVAFIIQHAPPQLHLVIASRAAVPLPLVRLRAQGDWLDVDAMALRFDEDETSRFLHAACSQRPTVEQVARLHRDTEGWAAALRLAALGSGGAATLEPSVSGTSRAFASLIEDLLESLPPATVRFMVETAVLEHLNAELCDAVTGRADATELLDLLMRDNLLVEPLDSEGRWLRYHQLLRDYLLGPLAQRLKISPAALHLRAAHWFARQSAWTDAVRHALDAGDSAQAIEWMAHCGMALVTAGDLITLLGWRRQFPPELLSSQPRVQLAVAWGLTLALRYQEAKPLLDDIERALDAVPPTTEQADVRAQCLTVRAVAMALQDDSLRAGELVAIWRERGISGGAWTFNVVSNIMRFVNWKAGNWVGVYEQPWEPYTQGEDRRHVYSIVYREVLLGNVELEQARLGLAERHAREAMRQAELHAGAQSVSVALAAPLLASLYYEQGQVNQALSLLQPLTSLIDNTAILESVMQAYLVLARIAQAQGQCDRAFALLEHAEAIGYNRGWDRLVAAMLLERLKWLLAEGRLDEAKATGVRMGRLAVAQPASPHCARADLFVFRDWGQSLLALADQRADEARTMLQRLLTQARAASQVLRGMQLGATLTLAHAACDDKEGAFATLRDVIQVAQRSGAGRCMLDVGADLRILLPRFLVSSHCDAALGEAVRRLLALEPVSPCRAATQGLTGALTERERDVLMLVAFGRSNKEVARAMNISAETVKSHLKSTFAKLGVRQRAQAVVLARSLGLIGEGEQSNP